MRIGLDIGGTKIASVLLDERGDVVARAWTPHSARGIEAVARALADAAGSLGLAPGSAAIGVSVSGLVRRDGYVTGGASLEVRGDLQAAVRRAAGSDVLVVNDAQATLQAVLRQAEEESGSPIRDAALLTIGTGVGGAIVTDGRLLRGPSGLATELGHLPVMPPNDQLCVCGSSGCLEQYAGGHGIGVLARRSLASPEATGLLRAVARDAPGGITAEGVAAAARLGDAGALALLDQAASACSAALRAICVSVEPEQVFLGGSVVHGAQDLLLPRIEHHMNRLWPFAEIVSPPRVRVDSVGPYAAAIGAGLLAAR